MKVKQTTSLLLNCFLCRVTNTTTWFQQPIIINWQFNAVFSLLGGIWRKSAVSGCGGVGVGVFQAQVFLMLWGPECSYTVTLWGQSKSVYVNNISLKWHVDLGLGLGLS